MYPEFSPLKSVLHDGTVDELKKRCNTQLYGTRGRNGSKGLQDQLDDIPTRIDEVSSVEKILTLRNWNYRRMHCWKSLMTTLNSRTTIRRV